MIVISAAKRSLSIPFLYEAFQSAIGARAYRRRFIVDFVGPRPRDALLDVGCGTGTSLDFLPSPIAYTGIDISSPYIARARARYQNRGCFLVGDASSPSVDLNGPFDRIFTVGVLHHLSDEQVRGFIRNLVSWLKPGGKFVSIDPCSVEGQHPIAKFLIANDRGEYVRKPDDLLRLFSKEFSGDMTVMHNLLRIPYSHVILTLSINGGGKT